MNSQDFRSLQEAYLGVVMNEGLGGAPDPERVQRRLNKIDADIEQGEEMYDKEKAPWQQKEKAEKAQKFLRKHPRKRRTQGESIDLYDLILSHLLDEGYADTQESADAIMVNMSEEWRESIVENQEMGPRRSAIERKKRAKELGDRQTIANTVSKYNQNRQPSRKENPEKYYSK